MEASFPVSSFPFNRLCKASTALIQQKLSKSKHIQQADLYLLWVKKNDERQQSAGKTGLCKCGYIANSVCT